MKFNATVIKKNFAKVDWNLLIFLLLFMNVKLVIKVIGLCFIYFRRFDLSFKFSFKKSRLPLFYPAMIGIAILNFLLYGLFRNTHYSLLLFSGTCIWILCILAVHQVKLTTEKVDLEKIHNALLFFFAINAFVSFLDIFIIILKSGALNPYIYQGNYQEYFMSTGDYIRSISFDTSTTNALFNAFGIMYFLSRKCFGWSLICMAALLLTASNLTNILVIVCFLFLFIFRSNRAQKSIIIVQLLMLVIFMAKISPHNNDYGLKIAQEFFGRYTPDKNANIRVVPITERPDSTLSAAEKKYKHAKLYLDSISTAKNSRVLPEVKTKSPDEPLVVKPEMPKVNIHAPEYQHKQDSSETRLQAIAFLKKDQEKKSRTDTISKKAPGKVIAFIQLFRFFKDHPSRIVTGNGLGNFSSKMAFRVSGLKIAGSYPVKYTYINDDFKNNHLAVYLAYFSADSVYHSIANSPNSVYAQLLGEYGLVGVCVFLFFYLANFTRSLKKLTYGLPVLLIMLGAFVSDYWFEQLSVVVLFELLMFLDIKSTQAGGEQL